MKSFISLLVLGFVSQTEAIQNIDSISHKLAQTELKSKGACSSNKLTWVSLYSEDAPLYERVIKNAEGSETYSTFVIAGDSKYMTFSSGFLSDEIRNAIGQWRKSTVGVNRKKALASKIVALPLSLEKTDKGNYVNVAAVCPDGYTSVNPIIVSPFENNIGLLEDYERNGVNCILDKYVISLEEAQQKHTHLTYIKGEITQRVH